MAFRIASPGERLKLEIPPTMSCDGSSWWVIYSRLLRSQRSAIVSRHGKGLSPNPGEWPQDKQEMFLDDVIRACYVSSEGTIGSDGADRPMTVDELLEQPEDLKAFLFHRFVSSSTRGAEALGNSGAT